MRRHLSPRILIGTAVLASGCTPTPADTGRMALVSAPFWFGMGWLALGALLPLWRDVLRAEGTEMRVHRLPSVLLVGALTVGAVIGAISMTPDGWSYFAGANGTYWFFALMVGFGYVTVALLVWRIWFSLRRSASSFTWSLVAVMVVFWLPGIILAADVMGGDDALVDLYVLALFPGIYGLPTAFVVAVLLVEAVRKARRATANGTVVTSP